MTSPRRSSRPGLSISTSMVATYGERAIDVFYVRDGFGHKIVHPARLEAVEAAAASAGAGSALKPPQDLKRLRGRQGIRPRMSTQTSRSFGHAAHQHAASGQLSGRAEELGAAAGARCPACSAWWTCMPSPRMPAMAKPRELTQATREVDGRLYRRRRRSQAHAHLQPGPGARACRAGLDLQLRGAAGLAGPHDPVQGEVRQAQGARQRRALHLSGADGGRHPGLQGHPCAGGRGPEAASGTGARHRPEVQQ